MTTTATPAAAIAAVASASPAAVDTRAVAIPAAEMAIPEGWWRSQSRRPPARRPALDGKKILERMTSETGGRLFEVSRKQPVADIYKQIAEELHAQYRLAFTPDKDTAADGYHQIDLADTKDKNLTIQTRDGYYSGK